MARIQIPLDALTSRLNLGSRFEGVRSQPLSTRFANLRPISEFLNLSRLSKPPNFGEVQSRVNYNLGYFSSNYVAVAIMLLIYSLLTNLTLLFDIVFVSLGLFGIKKLDGSDLELGFTRATTSQLYTGLFVIAIPLLIWANPVGTALWLVGATGVTILGHASFFRGGGLGGRPRTPHFTPSWGRSSRSNAGTKREPQGRYFEEVDSDDDDGQGVTLDANYFSDELHFTGADLGPYTRSGPKHDHGYDSHYSEEGEALEDRSAGTMQVALRNKEDLLVQQALERIRRAQVLGKRNVKLTQPEIDALERKRRQDEARPTRAGSGSKQVDTRRPSGQLQLAGKDTKPGRRRSSGLSPTLESIYATDGRGAAPPGIVVPGPDGRPMHYPIGYYPPANSIFPSNRHSQSGSRSGSSANLQSSTPPPPSGQYWPRQSRYPPGADYAPPPLAARASSSMRRLPDDPHWDPRPRSASSNYQYSPDPPSHQPYPSTPLNSTQCSKGRRIGSGPAEVHYSSLSRRRVALSSTHAASSDPTLPRRAHRAGSQEEGSGSEDETDDDDGDYGVQVNFLPYEYGYQVRRGTDPRLGIRPRKSPR
ncbi:MAG: hypothetical protein Q9184_000128 [Pyrenodesmia sp. 2 TL-2023]